MKGKHAQKDFGAVGAMAPPPLSLKTWGGGGRGRGGLGGVAYKDRAWQPPRGWDTHSGASRTNTRTHTHTCAHAPRGGRDNGPYADSFPIWCHFHGGGGLGGGG